MSVEQLWQPSIYLLGQGFIGGLAVGFLLCKFNKVVAALMGGAILSLNVLWFMRQLGIDTGFEVLSRLGDALFGLLPFSLGDVTRELEPMMVVSTQVPFIGGFILGFVAGFKLA